MDGEAVSEIPANNNAAPSGLGAGIVNHGTMTINKSQVNGNSAPDGVGGGIVNDVPGQEPATLTLNHSQVNANAAAEGGGIFNFLGPVTLASTSVSVNTPDNCEPFGSISGCFD